MKKYIRLYEAFINWLHGKLNPRQFLIFSSILVGITAGFAAVILKSAVHYLRLGITYDYHLPYQYIFYLIFPVIGILLTVWFVNRILKGHLGRGTANILYAIARKSSFLPRDQMYSHIITSTLTVGFGGSGGLESPIVVTGSTIGSNYARTYNIDYKERTLLLACGAAAGIAGAFNAPIAGVLFALEVLLADVSISAFIPLIIASATGGLLSKIILNENILFSFHLRQPFDYRNLPYYLILGLLAGGVSVYYSRIYLKIESFLKPKKKNPYRKVILGGLMLGILILFFPPLFSEGYDSIKMLADMNTGKLFEHSIIAPLASYPWILVLLVLLTLFFKVVATGLTIGSGGNAGNFAPSLFVGAYLGFAFAGLVNLLGLPPAPVSNFTIVAMAGILSGVFHAPLTGIFLIAEITGGYELMIPLMMVSATSFLIVKYFEPLSMDARKLVNMGHVVASDKDTSILSSLSAPEVIETDFRAVPAQANLRQLVELIAHSQRNIFPVIADGVLQGIILLDNIRDIMFKHELYDTVRVSQLMRKPAATITIGESMQEIMKKFDETDAWNLPVIQHGKYIGFISKSRLLTKYRETLVKSSIG